MSEQPTTAIEIVGRVAELRRHIDAIARERKELESKLRVKLSYDADAVTAELEESGSGLRLAISRNKGIYIHVSDNHASIGDDHIARLRDFLNERYPAEGASQ
jgi:hypothetical protein